MREFTIMEVEFFFDPNSDVEPPLDRLYDLEINILRGDDKARGEEKYTKYKFSEIVNEKIVINKWMAYWMGIASNFVNSLGISSFYFEEKLPHERAHYSKQTFDQIVVIDNVKVEISGHAYRSDYDLSRHSAYSGQDLSIFKKFDTPKIVKKKTLILNKDLVTKEGRDFSKTIMEIINTKTVEEIERMILNKEKVLGKDIDMYVKIVEREEKISGERVIPHVIEPSFGVERCLYLTLLNSYMEKDGRIILSLPKRLSPYDIAIFPLLEKDELIKKAREIYDSLKERYDIIFDDSGSIGKRYARVDEIGVPYSITVDPMTLTDNTVTIRDRDSWQQIRVNITDLMNVLDRLFKGEDFNKLGKLVSNNE